MESGKTLIDLAANKVGSRYKLAKAIGESQSFLSRIEHGSKPMPPSVAARIAVLAGIDARQAALFALVSQEKDAAKQAALASALGLPIPVPASDALGPGLLHKFVSDVVRAFSNTQVLFGRSPTPYRARLLP